MSAEPEPIDPVPDKQTALSKFYAVVAEVLGLEAAPIDEHFLDVGGDSLSVAIIVDWVAQEFGVEPELDWFFESENIKELAERWYAKLSGAEAAAATGS